ncbi:uncharacterized protein PGRI_038360 [Penicillium griseofulvum]|uniref:P68 RBP/TagC-like beta-propeller domain-containing protein n=1 Tax=Penicillium patulum TaxID=5078 RepID=A0A135LDW5_PENPA|nr:uncharacterized protein PGRI_038360 [Penicillium griseofulvum]KXG47090.1 hypothetical protein PGRI_038360 [Penicillium griseofulvum]
MIPTKHWTRRFKPAALIFLLIVLLFNAQPVQAKIPTSQRFDLSKPSYDLFRSKSLHDVTIQQGFAFDNTNRRLFVSQRRDGSSDTAGDLCITQLDFDGKYVGHMHLKNFGHGVSFGAQAVGSSSYLWTEVEANSNGYGKKLARFKFVSGTTLSSSSSSLKKFAPVAGATEHTCSIDPVNNRLIVRANLSDASKLKTASDTFQGYAAYGQYIYLLYGNSYDVTGGKVNSDVTTVDMNTGAVVQGPLITKAGSTLSFREPEGLAIYKTAGGEVRLFLGFASGEGGDRRSNLFYKNALV